MKQITKYNRNKTKIEKNELKETRNIKRKEKKEKN